MLSKFIAVLTLTLLVSCASQQNKAARHSEIFPATPIEDNNNCNSVRCQEERKFDEKGNPLNTLLDKLVSDGFNVDFNSDESWEKTNKNLKESHKMTESWKFDSK